MSGPSSAFKHKANSRIRKSAQSSLRTCAPGFDPPLLASSPGTTSFPRKTCPKNEAFIHTMRATGEIAPSPRAGSWRRKSRLPGIRTVCGQCCRAEPAPREELSNDTESDRPSGGKTFGEIGLEVGHILKPDVNPQNRTFFGGFENLTLAEINLQRQAGKTTP